MKWGVGGVCSTDQSEGLAKCGGLGLGGDLMMCNSGQGEGGNVGASGDGSPWCGPSGAGELVGHEVEVLEWWGGRWGGLGG